MISVNMANWFTRMWKYAPEVVGQSEYLLHSVLIFGTELSDDIFAFGNCYDEKQYKNYTLFCPYAYKPECTTVLCHLARFCTRRKSIYAPEVELSAVFLVKSQSAVLIFDTKLSDDIFALGNWYDDK